MTEQKRLIAPRQPSPSSRARDSGRLTDRLPDDVLREQVRRFALFTGVGGGLWTVGLVMDTVLFPATLGAAVRWRAVVVEVAAIAFSIFMFLYVRYCKKTPQGKIDLGLAYMLVNAAGIALLNTWVTPPTAETLRHLSWITVVILISSMIMPSTPKKMLAASLAAASMDPLGVWIAHLRGFEVPSLFSTLVLCTPNYSCAIVAVVPARFLQRIGRRLREAEDLGSYRLMERLGHGGMGEVWRAQHRLIARQAAIKLIRPELLGAGSADEARHMMRRFEREARATASLSSPHTIQLFDYGLTDDGTFYYVMELLTGRDLETLIRDFGPMPAERAMFLLRQVCHSLADAHARGLVHRDIKPANIYVCRMGLDYDFAKVLDFGLVKFNARQGLAGDSLLTADQHTTGTPAYMAPEVILGDTEVDRRADVYAVGCVAYYLLTGQLVFEAETPMKMLMHHVQTRPLPPSQRTELRIPRELDELVLSCLEKDPGKRPQNAEELFRRAVGCTACETWTQERASLWWQTHLPELTGPLSVEDPAGDPNRETAAIL
jgi:hypothetical protein